MGESERRAREEISLRESIVAVTDALSIQEATTSIADTALASTDSDGAFVERIDSKLLHVEVVAVAGRVKPKLGSRLPLHEAYSEDAIEHSKPLLVPRISMGNRLIPGDLVDSHGDCTAALFPLAHGGLALGVLVLLRAPDREAFLPQDLERARTFVDLASLAFHKVFLLEESERGREELRRLMSSRERLMRGFSHDLKNPLGAADGQLQFLEMDISEELSEQQAESIGRARRSIARAIGLIDVLTELARAETEQLEIESAPIDVREAARETADEQLAHARAKGLEVETDLPEELGPIESDGSRIRQILANLISNAVKYTDSGTIKIRVADRNGGQPDEARPPGPGRWIAVEVIDTGPGIPEQHRELIFEEFSRLNPAAASGAGVGLAISRRVAKALGGAITVASNDGRGSVFTLWLPRTSTPATSPDESTAGYCWSSVKRNVYGPEVE